MKIVYCEPGKRAEIREVSKDFRTISSLVGGGFINTAYPFREYGITLVCNDDFFGLEPNRNLPKADNYSRDFVFCGPFFICGTERDEDGAPDFGSLNEEQAERYRKMLDLPCDFRNRRCI